MMRPQIPGMHDLVQRDPALAYLMGANPTDDFGGEAEFGIGSVYDVSQNIGGEFGWEAGGTGGFGWGADAPATAPAQVQHMPVRPHPAAVAAAWQKSSKEAQHTEIRESLLDPNRHSKSKVERYTFSLNASLVLNVASTLTGMTLQPNTALRPQRVVANAPTPNFVLLTAILVANVNVFVGGTEDAFTYSATAMGVMLDLPTLQPANRLTVNGSYTGFVPPGFANNFAYTFIMTFQGPALIAGGSYQ
jgi:hypothetical protein